MLHEQRVDAAFAELPAARRTVVGEHFARLGLTRRGRQGVIAFWLRFIPFILLEDRRELWPWLDRIARLSHVAMVPADLVSPEHG